MTFRRGDGHDVGLRCDGLTRQPCKVAIVEADPAQARDRNRRALDVAEQAPVRQHVWRGPGCTGRAAPEERPHGAGARTGATWSVVRVIPPALGAGDCEATPVARSRGAASSMPAANRMLSGASWRRSKPLTLGG